VRICFKNARFAFLSPLCGGLEATYDVHWKAFSGLPISVNGTFLLGATAAALWANIDWK